MLFAAQRLPDSPVGIIAGSAVAVVLCMLIVIIMVIIFLRRSVADIRSASLLFCCWMVAVIANNINVARLM